MRVNVLGVQINVIDFELGINYVSTWGRARESRTVNFCNVHSIITARESSLFTDVLNRGDINFPDGGPIASWVRRKYGKNQVRISGPDFMLEYFEASRYSNEKVFLYGSTPNVLADLTRELNSRFPWVEVVGAYSPPFSKIVHLESEALISQINESGAHTVWVSLGCPKQEKWLDLHRNKVHCVMLGVGAAFPLISGSIKRAPKFFREHSLEWLYRLYKEPARLIGRYTSTNLKFLALYVSDIIKKH